MRMPPRSSRRSSRTTQTMHRSRGKSLLRLKPGFPAALPALMDGARMPGDRVTDSLQENRFYRLLFPIRSSRLIEAAEQAMQLYALVIAPGQARAWTPARQPVWRPALHSGNWALHSGNYQIMRSWYQLGFLFAFSRRALSRAGTPRNALYENQEVRSRREPPQSRSRL